MREIKFRAWAKNSGRMYKWEDHAVANNLWLKINTPASYVFMQYTGLTDKNGVEIYEGDIVIGMFGKAKIYWRDSTVSFELNDNGTLANIGKLEVIGNIYENPELLQ